LWCALLALVVPIVAGGPALADSPPRYDATLQKEPVVPVTPVAQHPVKVPAMPTWDPANAHQTWPAAGAADVTVAPAAAQAPSLPVRIAQAPATKSTAGTAAVTTEAVGRVHVAVASQQAAQRLGLGGVILQVARTDGRAGTGDVQVGLDYTDFRDAYGADWGTRLRLVSLPACALTTPAVPSCQVQTPLVSTNNSSTHVVSAVVPLSTSAAPPTVLAATATAAGGGGSSLRAVVGWWLNRRVHLVLPGRCTAGSGGTAARGLARLQLAERGRSYVLHFAAGVLDR